MTRVRHQQEKIEKILPACGRIEIDEIMPFWLVDCVSCTDSIFCFHITNLLLSCGQLIFRSIGTLWL